MSNRLLDLSLLNAHDALTVFDLPTEVNKDGLLDFKTVDAMQHYLLQFMQACPDFPDVVIATQVAPVYTVGQVTEHLFREEPRTIGHASRIPVLHAVDRQGSITYHGPGQLLVLWVRNLERAGRRLTRHRKELADIAIATMTEAGIEESRLLYDKAVWVDETDRIASVGVGLEGEGAYAMHGMALNVQRRAEAPFRKIYPCGDTDPEHGVTSMEALLGRERINPASMERIRQRLVAHMVRIGNYAGTQYPDGKLVAIASSGGSQSA